MEPQGVERKLAAILAADVAGYSRLMGKDEVGTLAVLKAHRQELFEPKAAQCHGRTIKLMGDGALMEFGSVVDAVSFAVLVQCAMAERNAEIPDDEQVGYRIGINIGDVIVDGDDIYGDGVNVAARLEGLAEPGGICVARTVFNHVKGKLDLTFEHLGEKEVKNIAEPVSVYQLVLDNKARQLIVEARSPATRNLRRPVAVAAAVALLVAIGGIIWWQPWAPDIAPASAEKMAFPLPDKPSIAVLPFTNMSDDPNQEYFVDGMTEDLITDLSKISGLFVIARNSTFTYKGKAVQVRHVAEELGVRYVLEGSVRRTGDQVRINAQLVDATTGGHIWAERYDGTLADIFALQDQVTHKIVTALAVRLASGESQRIGREETGDASAYDAYLQGWAHYSRRTGDDYAKAVPYFEQAIKLDPTFGKAYAALAAIYWDAQATRLGSGWDQELGFSSFGGPAYGRALEYLKLARKYPTPLAHQIAASLLFSQDRHEQGLAEIEQGLTLDPNDPESYVAMARGLIYTGRASEAFDYINKARRLNPYFPAYYSFVLGLAHFTLEDYEQAAWLLTEAMARNPENLNFRVLLIAAYGQLGRTEDATATITGLNEAREKRNVPAYRADRAWGWPYRDTNDSRRLFEGLIKAGME